MTCLEHVFVGRVSRRAIRIPLHHRREGRELSHCVPNPNRRRPRQQYSDVVFQTLTGHAHRRHRRVNLQLHPLQVRGVRLLQHTRHCLNLTSEISNGSLRCQVCGAACYSHIHDIFAVSTLGYLDVPHVNLRPRNFNNIQAGTTTQALKLPLGEESEHSLATPTRSRRANDALNLGWCRRVDFNPTLQEVARCLAQILAVVRGSGIHKVSSSVVQLVVLEIHVLIAHKHEYPRETDNPAGFREYVCVVVSRRQHGVSEGVETRKAVILQGWSESREDD